jgi:molybdopterin/thiamine biosynthesis adenylyltransferase
MHLAAAGIGHLGIVDADPVELNNLQRQIIHDARDLARAKVASAEACVHLSTCTSTPRPIGRDSPAAMRSSSSAATT